MPENALHPERASAAQLLLRNKDGYNSKKDIMRSKEQKDKLRHESSVNFYINIEKLRNLKVSNKRKQFNLPGSYLKKTGISYDRKGALLRNYGVSDKKFGLNSSYESGSQKKSMNMGSE